MFRKPRKPIKTQADRSEKFMNVQPYEDLHFKKELASFTIRDGIR